MNAIIGISDIELENEAHTPDVLDSLGRINNSGRTLLGIINDILDLSKVETGKLEILPVNYDIVGLISETVHLNAMLIGDKNIKFMVKADESLPAVLFGDDLRIKQVLNNILSNSIKYTDEGTVTLTVDCSDIAPVDTVTDYGYTASGDMDENKDNINLIFTVSDTGRGMTKEQIAALYDEYAMFDKDANRNTEGTGLGMSITKRIIELMNGKIEAESEPGVGSTLTVHIPQKLVDSSPIGEEIAMGFNDFGNTLRKNKTKLIREHMPDCKVLIVDDIAENLFVAKGLMKPYGLQTDTAESGHEALEKIRAGNVYDIIFIDHMMPGIDGIETTKILREEGYIYPVIALTAIDVTNTKEIYFESGFDGFIPKPFDIIELDNVLKKYFNSTQTRTLSTVYRLKEVSHLDVNSALSALGGMEDIYIDTVKITTRMMPERIKRFDNYVSSDIESFRVEVHGVKSVLVNIGAHKLSHCAAQLEHAAVQADTSYIEKNYPVFKAGLVELSDTLKEILQPESGGNGKIADKSLLPKIISEVKDAVENFDSILALDIINPYIDISYETGIDELLGKIVYSLEASDYDSALDNIAVLEDLISG